MHVPRLQTARGTGAQAGPCAAPPRCVLPSAAAPSWAPPACSTSPPARFDTSDAAVPWKQRSRRRSRPSPAAPCSLPNRAQGDGELTSQQTDDGGQGERAAGPSNIDEWRRTMPPRMLAAMALSPLAALALPLATNESWISSARTFGDSLRVRLQQGFATEGFQAWARALDDRLTYMDWTAGTTGIDLSRIWDPELWTKFKEAVWTDQPQAFWNALADRIEYKATIPQAGLAGDMRISYGKFLQLLETDRVKRVVVYGDMKTAIVEVPHPWYASVVGAPGIYPFAEHAAGQPISLLVPNPAAPTDPLAWYCPEMPEWSMEKYRFYVDLPGDFWERGTLLRYLRSRDVAVVWDAESRQYLMPHKGFTKVFQVRTEVQLLDPSANWDFVSWLTSAEKLDFYEKAAAVCLFCRLLSLSLDWATGTPVWRMWSTRKKKKKSKQESMWERLTRSTAREFMTKDAKTGKMRDTGVRFQDIAGLDHIIVEMREVVKMLLGDAAYVKVGAKVPRGIIFQGPPGTGKTYLARAIAGEAGVAFFSSVGSEFVEMFAGVAAARVNNLFVTARKRAPAIIFIDEIDAIGRARSTLGSDPGSMERESALLAMLVQMDGIHGKLESVLTIGATNLAQDLDGALLRPGRFEVVYEIPSPGPVARMEILKYHARNKQLADTGLLTRVAEVTQGWSAASLANLMNEAAILTVRRSQPSITLPLVMELVEGINWGTRAPKIPQTEAKNRLAVITAAKAVAFALTPGMEKIRSVSLWSRKRGLGPSVDFVASEEALDAGWHPEMVNVMDWSTNLKVNAATIGDERLGEFLHIAGLLVPLYAPRAAEVALYGPDAASLATAPPLADCFEIGYWCVRNSEVHPRFRSLTPLHLSLWMGDAGTQAEQRDPLAVGFDLEFGYHKLTLTLLKASWRRATRLVSERRTAVLRVAEALLAAPDEVIPGSRLVEIIEATPVDDTADLPPLGNDFLPLLKQVLGKVPGVMIDGEAAAPALDITPVEPEDQAPGALAEAPFVTAESGSGRSGAAEFRGFGSVSFSQPAALAAVPVSGVSGASGGVSFRGGSGAAAFRSPRADAVAPQPTPATAAQPGLGTEIRLTRQQLEDVSRAIMGRIDVVDLIGANTAQEFAERVRDALLDPETAARLQAVRRYVEQPGAPFPPPPLAKDVPLPLYGKVGSSLEYWKRRHITDISWSAMEMLLTPRQLELYRQDADLPMDKDAQEAPRGSQASNGPGGPTGSTTQ